MNIGLDAKRIFNNPTGLGVYGRNLIAGLRQVDKENQYCLFTPKKESTLFDTSNLQDNFSILESKNLFSYYWRSYSIYKDIQQKKIDIYHGLSNELPFSLGKTKAKSIVDIHDVCLFVLLRLFKNRSKNIFRKGSICCQK